MVIEGYSIANLSDEALKELRKVEVELSKKIGEDLVLVAWQKEAK